MNEYPNIFVSKKFDLNEYPKIFLSEKLYEYDTNEYLYRKIFEYLNISHTLVVQLPKLPEEMLHSFNLVFRGRIKSWNEGCGANSHGISREWELPFVCAAVLACKLWRLVEDGGGGVAGGLSTSQKRKEKKDGGGGVSGGLSTS